MARSVVTVLGAGASAPLPQTEQLTKIVCDLNIPISDSWHSTHYSRGECVPLFRILRDSKPELLTFEALMAEAWEMARSLQRGESPASWLSKLLDELPMPEMRSLLTTGLGQAAHQVGIKLKQCSDSLQARRAPPPIVPLLDRIADETERTVVATLNYDDLVRMCRTRFYDGFTSAENRRPFAHEFAVRTETEPNTLLWLHGSIHMNVALPTPGSLTPPGQPAGEIFWEADAKCALHGWVQGFRNDAISFPVAIATDKPRQLLRTPFLDYWHVLNRSLDSTTALVVIGYGGGDEHLNGILQDAVLRRGSGLRIVWCTRASSEAEVLSVLYRVFPTLINRYCPREPVVIGKSLQQVVNPPPGIQLPKLWVDPDGVDDLKASVGRLLAIIR